MQPARVGRLRRTTLLPLALVCALSLGAASAQQTPTPATPSTGSGRDVPRPDQLEPGVNSSTLAAPAPAPDAAAEAGAGVAPAAPTPGPAAADRAASSAAAPGSNTSRDTAAPQGTAASPGKAASQGNAASQAPAASGKGTPGAKTAKRGGPDRLELDPTDITGNRELPKVLYIVPWKRADLGDLMGKPVNSLLDEVLQPVDRDVFQRENRYYDGLKPAQDAAKAGAARGSQGNP